MRQLVLGGRIGGVVGFQMVHSRPLNLENPYLKTEWRRSPQHIGGFLLDGGVHDIAAITQVLGNVIEVSAFSRQINSINGADDSIVISLRLERGTIGSFSQTFAASPPTVFNFSIDGTEGRLVWKSYEVTLFDNEGKEHQILKEEKDQGFRTEFLDFFAAIKEGKPLYVTPEDAFHHLAIIAASLESAEKHTFQHIVHL